MSRSGFDPAPTWQVDDLVRRVDRIERERTREKDRRFRLWGYAYMALIWLLCVASIAVALIGRAH